jgi:hypothetical protein
MTHTPETPNNLAHNKSQLAKLLATENITVIINPKARTASFDTAKRILELPMWLNMDADVYDLLVGHEVGHALYTFSDELVAGVTALHSEMYPKDAGNDRSPSMRIVHQVVNVVEDPRIEKLTKRRYPGIRPAFNRGYKRLWTDGFFGQAAANVSALSITDRINLHFKVGTHIKVPFTAAELKLVAMVEAAETMSDVFAAARAIIEHVRAEQDKKQQQHSKLPESEDTDEQMTEDGDPSEFSEEYENDSEDSDDNDEDQREGRPCEDGEQESSEDGESEGDKPSDDDDAEESDEDSDEESEDPTADMRGAGSETESDDKPFDTEYSEMDALASLTESALAESQKTLAAGDNINMLAVSAPVFDLSKNVFDFKTVLRENAESFKRLNRMLNYNERVREVSEYKTKERANISYMLKEFELRRAARTHARTLLTKTGRLDTNKLHAYKTSDDLFRRNSIVNKGQSHGLFFLVDFSGSMAFSIRPLVDSLISLTMFCRLTNVPFEVYFFTDNYFPNGKHAGRFEISSETGRFKTELPTDGIISNRVYLRNILSSRMTLTEYNEACATFKMLSIQASDVDTMGGTPLIPSLMMASELIGKFKKDNGLDCVSFITMTDGMADGFEGTSANNMSDIWTYGDSKPTYITYTDKVTKRTYSTMGKTKNNHVANCVPSLLCGLIIKSIAERHNANTLGYFIADRRNASTTMNDLGVTDYNVRNNLVDQYKKEGFVSIKALGYDEFFVISPSTFDIRDSFQNYNNSAPTDMSAKKVFSEYRKTIGKRDRGRSLLKSFVARITAKDAA